LYKRLETAAVSADATVKQLAASAAATGEALDALVGGVAKLKDVAIPKLYKAMYLIWKMSANTRNLALTACIELVSIVIPPPFGTIVGVGLKLGLAVASEAEKSDMKDKLKQAKVTKTHLAEAKQLFPEAAEALISAGLEVGLDAAVDGAGKAIPIIGTLIAAVKTAYQNWKLKKEVTKLLKPEPLYLKEMLEQVKELHSASKLLATDFLTGVTAMDDILKTIRKEKCPDAVSARGTQLVEAMTIQIE